MKKIKYEKPEIMEIGEMSEWVLGASCSPSGGEPSSNCDPGGGTPSSKCDPIGGDPKS